MYSTGLPLPNVQEKQLPALFPSAHTHTHMSDIDMQSITACGRQNALGFAPTAVRWPVYILQRHTGGIPCPHTHRSDILASVINTHRVSISGSLFIRLPTTVGGLMFYCWTLLAIRTHISLQTTKQHLMKALSMVGT